MKRGRKSSIDVAIDVSYAEIMEDVKRLKLLIGDVENREIEKPRKKRKEDVKSKVEDLTVKNPKQETSQKKKYEVSNIEEVREKIQTSNVSSVSPQSEVFQTDLLIGQNEENTSELTPQQQIAVNESTSIESIDGNKIENQSDNQVTQASIETISEEGNEVVGLAQNELSESQVISNDSKQQEGETAEAQEEIHHHWVFEEPVSSVDERRAARLAKYKIDPSEEIMTTKLKLEKSGQAWGTWSDAIDSDDSELEM